MVERKRINEYMIFLILENPYSTVATPALNLMDTSTLRLG